MVETTWLPFDTHVQQLEAEGPVTYERMVELVAMLQQQWRFPFDSLALIEEVQAAEPGIIRQQAITHAVNTYFDEANGYLDMVRQVFPDDEELIYERSQQVPGYQNVIHHLKKVAVGQVAQNGYDLIASIWNQDPGEVREAVQDCVVKHMDTPGGRISQEFISDPRFEHQGDLFLQEESGRFLVRFWGRNVMIPTEIGPVYSVHEMISGHSVFVIGRDGRQHIVKVDLPGTERNQSIDGELVSLDAFDQKYWFGEQTSMDAIRNAVHDQQFRGELSSVLRRELNLSILPLYGIARLRECLYIPELEERALRFIARHGADGLYVLNALRLDELQGLLPQLERLHELEADTGEPTLESYLVRSLSYAYQDAFSITQAENSPEGTAIVRLLEKRLKKQLLELSPVLSKIVGDSGLSTEEKQDIEMAARSFEMVCRSASNAVHTARGEALDVQYERFQIQTEDVLAIYSFIERHPQAPGIFQANFEFIQTVLMAQENNPLIDVKEEEKPQMYQKLAEGDKLHEVPTTDTATDTARAVSLIKDAIEKHNVPQKGMRILFVGMNTAKRFEKPVVENLRASGIGFGAIIGIDQNDFSDEARNNLDIQKGEEFAYHIGNLQKDEFPDLEKEGQVDVVVVPWSMLNDLLKTMSFAKVMYMLQGYLKDGGVMITDNPIPAGIHSYEAQMKEAARQGLPFGHVLRTLKAAGEDVETMFNIYLMQYLTTHCMALGMEPLNFPGSLAEQAQIAKALSDDDADLVDLHEAGLDKDAVNYPVYHANGANRMTLAFQKVGNKEVMEKHGIFPMWLYERAIRPGRKARKSDSSESDEDLGLAA